MNKIVKTFCLALVVALFTGCAGSPDRTGSTNSTSTTSQKQAISKADRKRNMVVDTVQKMIGVRYKYGGTTPKGFDCSGLVWYSHKKAGINIPRTAKLQMKGVNAIRKNRMRPGDLLFFKTGWGSSYHVGTYIGAGLFVHAPSSGKKVSTASMDNPYWKKRLKRIGSYY